MKYVKTVDIWAIPHDLLKHLQPGQWVQAGSDSVNKGRFCGVTKAGTVWVSWTRKAAQVNAMRQSLKQI